MLSVWRRNTTEYPPQLEDLTHPPSQIYALGERAMLDAPLVAIVGTRDATGYGLRSARAIAGALARAGVSIVSGMARGIDAAAHRAALEAGGRTVAVLGTGIDVPYPVGHRELHELLSDRALVLSEYGSGVQAHRGAFPRRNRIIAALAPLTIVIEAGQRSGALNTASQALELDRIIGVVPGPIDSKQSVGSNGLLLSGAVPITSIDDALSLAGVSGPRRVRNAELSEREARVWNALVEGDVDADTLATRTALPTSECLAAISTLEVMGMIECLITGEIRRR